MLEDPAADGRAIHHHEDRHHRPRPPAVPLGDETSHPRLAVDTHEHALKVEQARLDLDHQQDAGPRVEREEVDAASLPVVIEGGLRDHQPAEALEAALSGLAQPRVIGVEEARQITAVPPNLQVDDGAEGRSDLAQSVQLVEADAAGLEPGDDRLRDA